VVVTAFIAALVGGLIGGVLVARPHFSSIQYGDAATWATALIGAPAVYIGVKAFLKQRSELEALQAREQARDDLLRRQLDRERRSTAVQVVLAVHAGRDVEVADAPAARWLHARVLNNSDRSIFNVDCRFMFEHNTLPPERAAYGILEHDEPETHWLTTAPTSVPIKSIAPGVGAVLSIRIGSNEPGQRGNAEVLEQLEADVQLRFTDEFEEHWMRLRDGELRRLIGRPDW